ncbi:unnamed protein product, partial [Rotaria sp. Silwood2]
MSGIKLVIYVMFMVAFLASYCIARGKKDSTQSDKKRNCTPIGDLCNDVSECCDNRDPDVGHCVYCRKSWPFGRQYRCDCSSSGAVTVDENGNVNTDRCNGIDRRHNRCRVSVAPPNDWHARGKNIRPKTKDDAA